ncbi:MAG: hypothetical protein KJ935_02040, partial [Candidatus Omnitrophica bacterium]|nr:hypothetical protein [Candidatus Omnitrophota bacterium]
AAVSFLYLSFNRYFSFYLYLHLLVPPPGWEDDQQELFLWLTSFFVHMSCPKTPALSVPLSLSVPFAPPF